MKNSVYVKKKKCSKKQKKIFIFYFFVLGVICILVSGGYFVYKHFSGYKIDNRVEQIKQSKDKFNTSIVGWLKVQGTNIDYPVVYNSNDFSVNSFTENNFVWTNENNKDITNRVFIVGHNILNVSKNPIVGDENHSRFEQLMSYIYYDFVEDNKYIQYTINGKNYLYKIFSVSFVKDNTLDYGTNSYSKSELKSYINQSLKDSYFKFDIDVSENDNIITLVTCTRMFGSTSKYTFKIDARMVRDGEATTNYEVTKKSNYDEILEIMEGDVENEEV